MKNGSLSNVRIIAKVCKFVAFLSVFGIIIVFFIMIKYKLWAELISTIIIEIISVILMFFLSSAFNEIADDSNLQWNYIKKMDSTIFLKDYNDKKKEDNNNALEKSCYVQKNSAVRKSTDLIKKNSPTYQSCPYCLEKIPLGSIVCPKCNKEIK